MAEVAFGTGTNTYHIAELNGMLHLRSAMKSWNPTDGHPAGGGLCCTGAPTASARTRLPGVEFAVQLLANHRDLTHDEPDSLVTPNRCTWSDWMMAQVCDRQPNSYPSAFLTEPHLGHHPGARRVCDSTIGGQRITVQEALLISNQPGFPEHHGDQNDRLEFLRPRLQRLPRA